MRFSGRNLQVVLAIAAAPVLLGALYPLQLRIDRHTRTVQREKEQLLLRSPRVIRHLSLGYGSLLANIYWTRAVQYYGGKVRDHDPAFELLWPLLDITTTLDPHLLVAYKFGAMFLAEPPPRGAGKPELAVTLLQRAIQHNPDDWRLWHDLGFIYYQDLKDYQKAAATYREGARHPQARDWMRVMAAKIAQEGGSRETSRFLWTEIYNSTQDNHIRKNAMDHLEGLKAEEDAEVLQQLAAEFARDRGRAPSSLQDLIAAGMLRGVPLDPSGKPYVFRDGKVYLHPQSTVISEVLQKRTTEPQP